MLISVVIPVYNNLEGLKASLNSLVSQNYENWEAIVVDDGSSVNHKIVVDEFNDYNIIFHRFDINKGRPQARQKTFELLSGVFCAFLDAGDLYDDSFLLNAVNEIKAGGYFGVSQSMRILYKGNIYFSTYINKVVNTKDDDFNNISFASTIIESKICKNYKFNSKLKYSQDKHFLSHISKNYDGDIKLLDTHSYIYDQGSSMKLSTTLKKYYYDILRLKQEGRFTHLPIALSKMVIFSLYHLIFGYSSLLKIRFKHIN